MLFEIVSSLQTVLDSVTETFGEKHSFAIKTEHEKLQDGRRRADKCHEMAAVAQPGAG